MAYLKILKTKSYFLDSSKVPLISKGLFTQRHVKDTGFIALPIYKIGRLPILWGILQE